MHLIIGAGEFLGDHVSHVLAGDVPVIAVNADADDETLGDAMRGIEVVHLCAETWSPARRLHYRKTAPPLLKRVVDAARRAGVRRIVHISTADVFGPDHFERSPHQIYLDSHGPVEGSAVIRRIRVRVTEKTRLRPVHAYERLKLFEEQWLLRAAPDLEVIIVRPARVFGVGEDWILPRLMGSLARGRLWLPAGGRSLQTFVSAHDVGRACLAAADRGRPGHSYLVAGFDASWRDLLESAARVLGIDANIGSLPYDLAYLKALATETVTSPGAVVWPGIYAIDVLAKPHFYDDSHSRRELTWSPSVGSFEQEIPHMAGWLAALPGVTPRPRAEAISPPGT